MYTHLHVCYSSIKYIKNTSWLLPSWSHRALWESDKGCGPSLQENLPTPKIFISSWEFCWPPEVMDRWEPPVKIPCLSDFSVPSLIFTQISSQLLSSSHCSCRQAACFPFPHCQTGPSLTFIVLNPCQAPTISSWKVSTQKPVLPSLV